MGVGKIPIAGDAVGWVVEDIQESVVEHYTRDSSSAATVERDEFLEQQRASSASAIHDETYTAAIQAGVDPTYAEDLANSASNQARENYGLGRQREAGTG
jgi:hypothetical protein